MKVSELVGLILVGGQSTRMGEDKLFIAYHGKPQVGHLLEIMNECLEQTFVSVGADQKIASDADLITDAFEVQGPLNGLLSAHNVSPDKSWLALAVDMPLVNAGTIQRLIDQRDESKLATVYESNGLPEPLAAIWEPKGLALLKQYFDSGEIVYPRRFLIENDVKLVKPANEEELLNVNHPEDLARVRAILKK